MPKRTAKANAKKAAVRATVEHVFAQQKQRMKLVVRSIGRKRAQAVIGMATIADNLGRWRWWQTRTASARREIPEEPGLLGPHRGQIGAKPLEFKEC